jgi:pullulanase/glycogen debranching enzyme
VAGRPRRRAEDGALARHLQGIEEADVSVVVGRESLNLGAVWPGSPFPLGATPEVDGTNFAVSAPLATAVELILFDEEDHESRLPLPELDAGVWHGFVPGVHAGQRYGYRARGPHEPRRGLLFQPGETPLGSVREGRHRAPSPRP